MLTGAHATGDRGPFATAWDECCHPTRKCIEGQAPERPQRVVHSTMMDGWTALGRLNADLLALGAESVILGWALLAAGAAWASWAPVPRASDLKVLGLDRMPSSRDELRRAYRRAAKATHPDAGGSADAFRVVTEAFERPAGKRAPGV
jgi:hypothetical protein